MDNSDKIIEGLERAYKKLIEFKKYKKTPIIVSKDGKIVEINPDKINPNNNVYSK
jgi:sulfur carrier protein ThiS